MDGQEGGNTVGSGNHCKFSLAVMSACIPNSFYCIPRLKDAISSLVFMCEYLQDPGVSKFSGLASYL